MSDRHVIVPREVADAVERYVWHRDAHGLALCETYAREPKFYGATYCVGCSMHLPVAEFVWSEDGQVVGS